jgi:chaperonin GroEL
LVDIGLLKERIANLSGGVATIHIGALTPLELKEKKDRYEDAIRAVNAAISEGIIAGGGAGLLHAVKEVSDNHKPLENPTQEHGYQTFLSICEMPAKKIIDSTGKRGDYILEKIKETNNPNYGFNAKKEVLTETMYEDGVIDPILVTKTALAYATSVAGTFITTDCVVTDEAQNVTVSAIDPLLDEERGML